MTLVTAPECTITISRASSDDWDDLVASFPGRTVFHSLDWLQTIAAAHEATPVLARAERDGRCVGLWPALEISKGPLRVMGSPLPGWSTAYMGPLIAADVAPDDVIAAFLDHRLFRRCAYFACRTLTSPHEIDLSSRGFSCITDFETYRIDLTVPEETLWMNLRSNCRNMVRKAERLGIEVHEETTDEFIDDFWTMSLETFARVQIEPTHTRSFVTNLWRRLRPTDRIRVYSAMRDGERLATLMLPFDDHTMYYWGGVGFEAHRRLPSHNLLHWHAILQARALGLQTYDMISVRGGPGRFKKSFGPQRTLFARHWERSSSRLMAVVKNGYERMARRRRRVSA